jgi:hypothetical protein
MINRAKQIYKKLFNRDDFWVSSVTGGHDAGTPHAMGYKADVGGSALKESYENRVKFQQALQAEGIGANNEYDQPSAGSTGPHFDLDARGTNWQTGEEFGGFKGGGGSSRTVNAHDSGYEDRMIRRLEAARADWKRRKADEGNTRLEGYQSQIQNAGSAENALSILERIKGSEKDPAIYSKAIQTARTYYPDAFKVSNSITGTRRTGSSRTNNKIVGSDGETYTKAQIRRAQSAMKRFYNDEHITEAEQERYDNAANILKAVGLGGDGDNLDNPEAFTVAREVWNQTQDYGKAHKWLQDVYGFTYNEATYYLDNME